MERESKVYSFKAAISENGFSGGPSVIGNRDQSDDVICPGFFDDTLGDFMLNGFVAVAHQWDKLPVGYPTLVEIRGNQLYSEAEFHTHQAAQDARTVAMERRARGMNMGLSIGFATKPDGTRTFRNGHQLLEYAKALGCDMSVFNRDDLESHKTSCRGLLPNGCRKLFEYSITPAPMNELAVMDEVKTISIGKSKGAPLRNAPTLHTLAIHLKVELLKADLALQCAMLDLGR